MLPPNKTMGIVPIKIELTNLLWRKYSKILFDDCFLNLKISSLKYQISAKTLPSWIIAEKDVPGSSIPKRRDITFKWAVLLTGKNSVNPWIMPYRINSKYPKKLFKLSNLLIAIMKKQFTFNK